MDAISYELGPTLLDLFCIGTNIWGSCDILEFFGFGLYVYIYMYVDSTFTCCVFVCAVFLAGIGATPPSAARTRHALPTTRPIPLSEMSPTAIASTGV